MVRLKCYKGQRRAKPMWPGVVRKVSLNCNVLFPVYHFKLFSQGGSVDASIAITWHSCSVDLNGQLIEVKTSLKAVG